MAGDWVMLLTHLAKEVGKKHSVHCLVEVGIARYCTHSTIILQYNILQYAVTHIAIYQLFSSANYILKVKLGQSVLPNKFFLLFFLFCYKMRLLSTLLLKPAINVTIRQSAISLMSVLNWQLIAIWF